MSMNQDSPEELSLQDLLEAGKKDVPWYQADMGDNLKPEMRLLLETYSGITPSEVEAHIISIRDRAYSIRAYACIGLWAFLDPAISHTFFYPDLLDHLKQGHSLLDMGCCLGQDLRRLVVDGAPSENMYGADMVNFWDLGYEMFHDREKFKARFLEGDLFSVGDAAGSRIEEAAGGRMDMVNSSHVLHLFNYSTQLEACKKFTVLLKPVPGAMVIGLQIGSTRGYERPVGFGSKETQFLHTPESFERMWRRLGEETGTKWHVDSRMVRLSNWRLNRKQWEYIGEDARGLEYIVRRL